MNSHQLTCDPKRIELYLKQELSDQEQVDFELHLDHCDACRVALEQVAAAEDVWSEIRESLRSAGPCLSQTNSALEADPAGSGEMSFGTESLRGILAPTDDERMLGRLGAYEVVGVIGSGGMGVVLKASDAALNRYVAIKVLAPHLASSGAARKRFSREAQAAAAVIHENVIEIYGVSEANGLPYLVMPYVRGPSLQKRLDDEGPLSVVEILRVAKQAADGLEEAHAQGLVHRDVKPGNIMLADGVERVKLTDFGLARAVDDASMTKPGVIAGTPQYMSPEQARGDSVDGRSDLFSLGCVMYAMCTGRPPFRAETSYGILRRITDTDARSIREINPDVPDWLCDIIGKLMEKRPDDRFESAADVAELLADCLAHMHQPTATPLPECIKSCSIDEPAKNSNTSSKVLATFTTRGGWSRPIGLAVFAFALLFAGILIVLDLNKGTLTIESDADNVPIRITQGERDIDVSHLSGTWRWIESSENGKKHTYNDGRVYIRGGRIITFDPNQGADAHNTLVIESVRDDVLVLIDPSQNGDNRMLARYEINGDQLALAINMDSKDRTPPPAAAPTRPESDILYSVLQRIESDTPVEEVEAPAEEAIAPGSADSSTGAMAPQKRVASNGMPLLNAIRAFNQEYQDHEIGTDQPPLTDDEVIASIRWAVNVEGRDEGSDPYREQLRHIVEQRQLPPHWSFDVLTDIEGVEGERFRAWSIRLVYRGTLGVPPYNHAIRDQLLWQLNPDGQPVELGKVEPAGDAADSKPLAATIHGFNSSHRRLAGLAMPPLTEQEVIAAIRFQKTRRDKFDITDGEFDRMQQIAETRRLPADAEIPIVTGFQPGDGYRYDIWSVRLNMRKQVNTVPYPFTGFTIREHYVRSQSLDLDKIAWGPVAKNGMQAGVRFEPRQPQYSVGQKVTPYFYYRNTGDRNFDIAFPNLESGKLVAVDNAGIAIPLVQDENPKFPVGFMGFGESGFGAQHEIRGRPIVLGDVERGNAEYAIGAQAGQAVRVHFVLPNYAH